MGLALMIARLTGLIQGVGVVGVLAAVLWLLLVGGVGRGRGGELGGHSRWWRTLGEFRFFIGGGGVFCVCFCADVCVFLSWCWLCLCLLGSLVIPRRTARVQHYRTRF